jgi:uncharacterized membrane protein YbhN (UPF0104 family)
VIGSKVWLRPAIGLLFGIAVAGVVAVYFGVSQKDIVASLQNLQPLPMIFAAVGALILLALQSLRWWLVMRPVLQLRYLQACKAMTVGFLFNALLPARGGDLLRVQYLGRRTGISRAKLLGTEIVDFWGDKWGWIVAFSVVCLIDTPPDWLFRALLLIGALVTGAGLVLVLLASGLLSRGPHWLINLRAGLAANHWRLLLLIETVFGSLPWLWEAFVIMVAGHAFGLNFSFMQSFATLTAFNLATAIPSPANAGSFEAGGALALIAFGVPKDTALAFIFVYHLTQLLPGLASGILILALDGEALFGWHPKPKAVLDDSESSASTALLAQTGGVGSHPAPTPAA